MKANPFRFHEDILEYDTLHESYQLHQYDHNGHVLIQPLLDLILPV